MKVKTKTAVEIKELNVGNPDHIGLLSETLIGFIPTCLPHYLTIPSAPYHFELADILQHSKEPLIEIIGFRGSAKTTFGALAFPLWAALTGEYKFIVIINDTSEQVRGNIYNIKTELENNQLIKTIYPNITVGETWSEYNLLLSNGVRIIGRSRGQNIRGIRHKQYRPDLIVVDDPENLQQVKTKENRDKTIEWFNAEVVPAAQENGSKLIVIGNLLHNDGFMARLARNPLFKVIKIPLVDEKGEVMWEGKYPNQEALDRQRQKVGEIAWAREYLLKIISPDEQIVKTISYWQTLPELRSIAIGVDLAISKKETADRTAISIVGEGVDDKYYVLDCRYGRWDFNETMAKIYDAWCDYKKLYNGKTVKLGIEDVAYQKAASEEFFRRYKIQPTAIKQHTDKKARLETLSPYFSNNQILFKEQGQELLQNEILFFGIEPHDDLLDSLELAIRQLINKDRAQVLWL